VKTFSWNLRAAIALAAIALANAPAGAQQLEPRLFSPAPTGMNIVLGAFGYSFGNILLDPSVPIEDLEARLVIITAGYVRTLNVFGASAKIDAIVPVAGGDWKGVLEGRDSTRSATGFGDPRVRFSVLFSGAPALSPKEFASYKSGTIVGGGLQVWVPLGQYDPTKLLNLGSNRWVFRPQLGVSQTLARWVLEAAAAGWFYTENTNFYGGDRLSQNPIAALQGHVTYQFSRGFWAGADAGYGRGGRTSVNDEEKDTLISNWRLGITLAIPISSHDSIKFGFVSGFTGGKGGDFSTVLGAYQYRWFDGP
jgi:hypothetical protein